MKTVYFIRHGESETNAGGIRLGDATPLTENGKKQAEYVAERASALPIDLIVSSNMERAKDTARFIFEKTGKPMQYSDLFAERRWPSWFTGTLNTDARVKEANKEMLKIFTVPNYRFADEENVEELIKRAIIALGYLKQRKEENIVVVTHGLFLRVMLAVVIFGTELSAHELDKILGGTSTENTGISAIKENEKYLSGWNMFIYNDHAHLADAQK